MPRLSNADILKRVLSSATEEARRRGDRRLGTDHLLLGLLHNALAARLLQVGIDQARSASEALDIAALAAVGLPIQSIAPRPDASFGRRFPPLTSGARAVLRRAIDGAKASRRGRIDAVDFVSVLLALHRPDPAGELLVALGVDPAAVRDRIRALPNSAVA